MTGRMQKEIFNEISRGQWEYLSNVYTTSGFDAIKTEAKILGVHASHLVAKINQFNKEMIEHKNLTTELDILKDLSFTERLQLALNYNNNYFEFSNNNTNLAE
jgi:hypothetical protein